MGCFWVTDHFETLQFTNVNFPGRRINFSVACSSMRGPKQVETLWRNIPWIFCLFSISSIPLPPSVFLVPFVSATELHIKTHMYMCISFWGLYLSLRILCFCVETACFDWESWVGWVRANRKNTRTMGKCTGLGTIYTWKNCWLAPVFQSGKRSAGTMSPARLCFTELVPHCICRHC